MELRGLVFAGIESAEPAALARFLGKRFRCQHFRAPDGCLFELVEERARPPA